ncbi:hypothetical protein NR798_13380 [Archangium gephyra]|uniref:hypothetical protein n=1 Tax=Archangium gephyra TaxID=48 RepID=UPI0035D401A2
MLSESYRQLAVQRQATQDPDLYYVMVCYAHDVAPSLVNGIVMALEQVPNPRDPQKKRFSVASYPQPVQGPVNSMICHDANLDDLLVSREILDTLGTARALPTEGFGFVYGAFGYVHMTAGSLLLFVARPQGAATPPAPTPWT